MSATLTVRLERARQPMRVAPVGRVPRLARLLALAHKLEAQIRAGEYDDLADAARKLGLSRARVTQIANLALLAPAIQEEILAMRPVTLGRETVTERALRALVAEPEWESQADMRAQLQSW